MALLTSQVRIITKLDTRTYVCNSNIKYNHKVYNNVKLTFFNIQSVNSSVYVISVFICL